MKSGRITADMRFAPWLEAHPNCSLRSQLLISANVRCNAIEPTVQNKTNEKINDFLTKFGI
jgi:hypothetical protein